MVLYLLGSATLLRAAEDPRPNVVFILTDDQGYGDASIHGHPLLKTPNIDRLADDGVRMDNFYVSPSCSPTRAALLTGMHEFRVGVTHTLQPREHLFADAVTLPSLMQSAGYATGFVGKWHLGNEKGYAPCDRGFDWCSTNQQGPRKHFDPTIVRNRKREMIEGYREDIFFDEAMTFIDESRDGPFFCYLATYSPHAPLDAPEEFVAPFRDAVDEKHAKYLGMVANLDYNVGRLTDFLDQRGLSDNTVVVFMNDNGQTEGLDVYNAGMRGCKCTIWEGGSRAMSFWKWPGHWQPHTVDNLTAHLDVFPTLCEIAGVEIPKTLEPKLEGLSMVPLFESETPIVWNDDRILFHHVGRWPSGLAASHRHAMCGVRQNNFLLLRSHPCDDPECEQYQSQCTTLRGVQHGLKTTTYTQGNAQFHWGVSASDRWSLFDSKQDPECQRDLSGANPELVGTLSAAYEEWWEELYPVMIARGGDDGDPNASRRAASRAKQHVAMKDKGPKRSIAIEDEFAVEREQVAAIGALTTAPAMRTAEGFDSTDHLKAIYFDALPWRGERTKAFAWLGMPGNLPENQKVPGMVLVHGGGGTAFKNWVQEWNDRGFAAISIAVEGQTDRQGDSKAWERHEWPGPTRVGIYGDSDEPLKDQWMYHAVADTVLANSLLRSLPQVDADRVGLMGISWGGVITSTVVGIDDRFAFAIPTYGCGHLQNASNQYGKELGDNAIYQNIWDPMQRLGKAQMPILWFSWPRDQHFPLDCQAASYRASSGLRMVSLVPGMGHGHGPPWRRPESYAFAKAIVESGKPWCRQIDSGMGDGLYRVSFASDKPLDKAVLVSTIDSGITGSRTWVQTPAALEKLNDQWTVVSPLPPNTTAWFINVQSGELVVSSDFREREELSRE